mmetsp:Transcript_118434/g.334851  ORF Transcript_118434/g.334851 Transcript_118434/m.334851 type:complete len:403 (+) Transcript_118434:194-1402(+)
MRLNVLAVCFALRQPLQVNYVRVHSFDRLDHRLHLLHTDLFVHALLNYRHLFAETVGVLPQLVQHARGRDVLHSPVQTRDFLHELSDRGFQRGQRLLVIFRRRHVPVHRLDQLCQLGLHTVDRFPQFFRLLAVCFFGHDPHEHVHLFLEVRLLLDNTAKCTNSRISARPPCSQHRLLERFLGCVVLPGSERRPNGSVAAGLAGPPPVELPILAVSTAHGTVCAAFGFLGFALRLDGVQIIFFRHLCAELLHLICVEIRHLTNAEYPPFQLVQHGAMVVELRSRLQGVALDRDDIGIHVVYARLCLLEAYVQVRHGSSDVLGQGLCPLLAFREVGFDVGHAAGEPALNFQDRRVQSVYLLGEHVQTFLQTPCNDAPQCALRHFPVRQSLFFERVDQRGIGRPR